MNRISTNPLIGFNPKFEPFSMNVGGRLVLADRPLVMGIVNCTSDSFYTGSRTLDSAAVRSKIDWLIDNGADIIDIGACSTRPGAEPIDEKTETERLLTALEIVRKYHKDVLVSIDTFRARVASLALGNGADIINDISGGKFDSEMYDTVAGYNAPYILMHSSGNPRATATVSRPDTDVTAEVIQDLAESLTEAKAAGINDIIVDPGFGFSKTIDQNYSLLRDLPILVEALGVPILAGVSRKSMLYRPLEISPDAALEATVATNTIALMMGASILRVHDPLPARQTIDIISLTYRSYLDN